jgi:4-amino-4-deoxy-L-arabinose transferase-like glycosyltransferase
VSGRALAAVALIALALRVALVLATPHFVPRTDAADYDRLAVAFVHHGHFPPSQIAPGPTALRPPLFPIALAGAYKLVGTGSAADRWEAGRLMEALFGAVAVVLIGLIAGRLWRRRAGLLAAGIAAVFPPLILVGSSLMSESLFIPLVLAAVLAASMARTRSWRWAALSGALVGLASLSRGNGIAFAVPIAFLVWVGRPRLSRQALVAPLAMLAALALTLTPWTIRNAVEFHEFVPITTETGATTAGTFNSYAAHRTDFPALWLPPVTQVRQVLAKHPRLNEAQLSDQLNALAFDYVKAHPAYVAKDLWWNTLRLLNLTGTHFERWAARYEAYPKWLASLSVYAFWALGLLALAGALTAAARRAPPALWGCPLVVYLSTVLLEGATRYRSPADPFIIMLAALAPLSAWELLRARRAARPRRRSLQPPAVAMPEPTSPAVTASAAEGSGGATAD